MKKLNGIWLALLLIVVSNGIVYSQDSTAEDYFKKGDYYYRNGDHAEAILMFDKAIALDASHLNAYLQRGACRNILKNFDGAISDFTTVIGLKPDHRWAYISRGSARNKTGAYKEAIDDFNKALEFDPTDQEAYNNRGFSKKLMGDKEGACEDWIRSKKLGNEEAKIILKNNSCK